MGSGDEEARRQEYEDKLNRRQLIKSAFAFGAAAALLPLAASLPAVAAEPRDDYTIFLEKVSSRVMEIVRREGRGLTRSKHTLPLWIDPPRACGSEYVRKVHLMLEPGPSLLDKLHFEFDVVSGSRMQW